ncbi:hypothetical protein EVA_17008 [gut metagenome]|uniref:Uncharacterized protein n=1 Tax=gut metagenome TaxID=749906 RepID=J9C4Y9_9ZZZZ
MRFFKKQLTLCNPEFKVDISLKSITNVMQLIEIKLEITFFVLYQRLIKHIFPKNKGN